MSDDLGKKLKARLRQVLQGRNVQDIAKAAKISSSYLHRLQRDEAADRNPSIDTIHGVCMALNIPLASFFAPLDVVKSDEARKAEDARARENLEKLLSDLALRPVVLPVIDFLTPVPRKSRARKRSSVKQ